MRVLICTAPIIEDEEGRSALKIESGNTGRNQDEEFFVSHYTSGKP